MRSLRWLGIVAAAYFAVGGFVHYVIVPEAVPDAFIPRVGDVMEDASSGERAAIEKRERGLIWVEFVIAPGGAGPPLHVHASSPESVYVESGDMSAIIGDEHLEIGPGESAFVPPGTAHRWFNAGEVHAVTRAPPEDRYGISETLVLCISQLWQIENDPEFLKDHNMLLQMSLMGPQFDLWDAEAPVWVQRVLFYLVAPTARLAGYRSAYPQYVLHPL